MPPPLSEDDYLGQYGVSLPCAAASTPPRSPAPRLSPEELHVQAFGPKLSFNALHESIANPANGLLSGGPSRITRNADERAEEICNTS